MTTLGFGCAALLGRASRKQSWEALGTAFDAGITFFDTARSYGYGASEGLLGEFLAAEGRRDKIVLCTKFGIQPAAPNWKQRLKPVARAAVRLVPSLRQAVQRRAGDQLNPGNFSVADLRVSFERSLRELKTDYVDILLLHAAPMSVLAQTDLYEALQKLVDEGKVRLAGISADQPVMDKAFAHRIPVLKTAQFAVNPANLAVTKTTEANSDLLLVANHPFAGPAGVADTKARIAALVNNAKLPKLLREKLANADDPQLFPELVFGMILSGTGIAGVLPAMMQPTHIRSNVAAIENCRFTPEELATLRSILVG
jgi:aryl-alcohol dehydrogenase-like predicted oxidoreductase